MFDKLDGIFQLAIRGLFLALFFLLPLIFWIPSSEVFELPKMYFVYAMTTLITGLWLVRMVVRREIMIKRTPLDIPILLFLLSQIISTIYSIDPRISWFGWYGRFNGGLLSTISYTVLYYALANNRFTIYDLRFTNKTILLSAFLVSVYALLQHFGIDKNFWVQDVMNRVFSTLGQPNWLAAYLVMAIPIAIIFTNDKSSPMTNDKLARKSQPLVFIGVHWYIFVLIGIYFLALLFTKSRSGLLGFMIADIVFWGLIFFSIRRFKIHDSRFKKTFFLIHGLLLTLILITNNPARDFLKNSLIHPSSFFPLPSSFNSQPSPTKSEFGGTESGDIRRIVWNGAAELVKQRPVFGFGPETFGLTYWQVRSKEANLTSEWNFLYNKAHNEWLNLAANTGLFGLGTHLLLLGWFSIWSINQLKIRNPKSEIRNKSQISNDKNPKQSVSNIGILNFEFVSSFDIRASDLTTAALLAAIVGVEAVNFFGFSTVTIGTYRYLFMALTVIYTSETTNFRSNFHNFPDGRLSKLRILIFGIVAIGTIFILKQAAVWFLADLKYNLGRQFNNAGYAAEAPEPLSQAVDLVPNEPVFRNELAESQAALAVILSSETLVQSSLANFKIISAKSKSNLTFVRTQAQMEFSMREIDPDLTDEALLLAQKAIDLSPTDPRGYYLLGRMYGELDDKTRAEKLYRQALELKPDYAEAIKILNTEY